MPNENFRSLLLGGAALAATKYYFKQPWCVAVIAGLATMVVLDFVTTDQIKA